MSAEEDPESIASLLAMVLAGTPDSLLDASLAGAPPEVHAAVRGVREMISAFGAGSLPTEAPSAALRARILRGLAARPEPRRALLVIDMLNDHLTPGRPLEVARARTIVPALAERIETSRRSGTPIVYVLDEHEPDDVDLDAWGTHNVRGSEGARVWPPLAPEPGDHIVKKPTYSGFVRSELAQVLDSLRVDTLVLTGCLTEIGLLVTGTDALQRGYAVEVPPDAQAGTSPEAEQLAMSVLRSLPPYGPSRRSLLERIYAA